MEKKATEEEAFTNCTQIDQSSTLLTIHSTDEQQFLNNLLTKYKNISNYVWIGMSYINKSYKWLDGTDTNFTNWSEDSVRDGTDPCVEMSLTTESMGKWFDVSCKRPALVVCQKKQDINLNSLKDVIENLTQVLEKQNQEIKSLKTEHKESTKDMQDEINELKNELKMNVIPIGFLYIQLPNQSSPIELWPKTSWSEVTQQYAGLFFRVEGGGSDSFGQIQQANQSWISNINARGFTAKRSFSDNDLTDFGTGEMNEGQWHYRDDGYGLFEINFYTTKAEVRPKNTAIKIWKRIQ